MQSDELVRGLLYLFLAVVGIPGNCLVIWAFLQAMHTEHQVLPADAIVLHLVSVNLLVVGVRCLLEALATFRLANIFSDAGCKGIIMVYRMARSLSIWLTFVLSTYQCLSIAPPGSRWAEARVAAARHLGAIFLVLWLVNAVISTPSALFSLGWHNGSSLMEHSINVQFCFVRFPDSLSKDANGAMQVVRDVIPMALMATASLIVLIFLYRHSQHVKNFRSSNSNSKQGSLAERRAAKTVVTLVTMYVLFYGVDNGLWVYTLTVEHTMSSSLVSDLRIFFSSLYAAVSPVVIIASNKKVSRNLICKVQEKGSQMVETTLSAA
ncbi:olfactory receptor class A related 2 [Scleropages formosus]|uniref:olfactory receptor class A related 2 n=1 Tax=Scleropages formosus TaxID=113540 RepID=UPI0008789BB4|nr:olfactory receptor class A-like protein 1 [Scleropages formosus]